MRRLLFIFITLACASTWTFAQTDESWREATQEVKDSIDAVLGESYAGECEKVLIPLRKEASKIERELTDSSSFEMHDLSDLGEKVTVYFHDEELVKIQVVLHYETLRDTLEYFFHADQLFLIRQTEVSYNTNILELENQGEKSEVYHTTIAVLNNEAIIHRVLEDCGAPDDPSYVADQQHKYLTILNTILEKTGHLESE